MYILFKRIHLREEKKQTFSLPSVVTFCAALHCCMYIDIKDVSRGTFSGARCINVGKWSTTIRINSKQGTHLQGVHKCRKIG
jgi:hypothetical protein